MFRPRQLLPRAGLLQRQERLGAGPRDNRAQQDYTLVINCTVLYFDVLYLPYCTVLTTHLNQHKYLSVAVFFLFSKAILDYTLDADKRIDSPNFMFDNVGNLFSIHR